MFICAILMGECHKTSVRLDGQARKSGYDSHKVSTRVQFHPLTFFMFRRTTQNVSKIFGEISKVENNMSDVNVT